MVRFVAAVVALATVAVQHERPFDLLIANGLVVDGSGGKPFRGSVAVRDGRIVAVEQNVPGPAVTVIDARGLVIAPGFIDVHTHADDLAEKPLAENFVRMGVTTIVAGNCGGSAENIGESLEKIRNVGPAVNYATLVGHNTVRRMVMGTEQRAPRPDELRKMQSLVFAAMTDGAVGLSTGLQYVPGTYADTLEIVALARVAADAGGVYASHMRNEGTRIEEAVRETISVCEAVHCRVQISHLKIDSPNRWGASDVALELMDAARRRGIDVAADQYVYTAGSSGLGIRFPSWALADGDARTIERLRDRATWDRIKKEMRDLLAERGLKDLSFAVVASHAADPTIHGLSLDRVALKRKGASDVDAQLETARDLMIAGGAQMVYHFMSEQDVTRIMRHPRVGIASDADVVTPGEGVPHPRGYGNAARVLARYVREQRVITLEEAVRKMTSLPAAHFRFEGRGLLKAGHAADVVVFDPSRVEDVATFQAPHQYAVGIPHVVVNGVPVVRDGQQTSARPGQIVTLAKKRP